MIAQHPVVDGLMREIESRLSRSPLGVHPETIPLTRAIMGSGWHRAGAYVLATLVDQFKRGTALTTLATLKDTTGYSLSTINQALGYVRVMWMKGDSDGEGRNYQIIKAHNENSWSLVKLMDRVNVTESVEPTAGAQPINWSDFCI